jgi:adenylosuccinate synthase
VVSRAYAVIGAAFGDEGKGLVTDYLAAREIAEGRNPIVVRFNGGAQAGHTVIAPDGTRHVFHHFCSGTLTGAPSAFGSKFIINPLMFAKELRDLRSKGIKPTVYMGASEFMTFPSDMLINQMIEEKRGKDRHGSCGLGIGETVARIEALGSVSMLRNDTIIDYLLESREKWVPMRMEQLGLDPKEFPEYMNLINGDDTIDQWVQSMGFMGAYSRLYPYDGDYDTIIYEGAQGLLLDAEHPFFPHVTRSRTGLTNVIEDMADSYDLDGAPLTVYYVTRTYTTRHGEGPFPTHVPDMHRVDITNDKNPWQGTLRFGHLDMDLILEAVQKDVQRAATTDVNIEDIAFALTWYNDPTEPLSYKHEGKLHDVTAGDLPRIMEDITDVSVTLTSSGLTRDSVTETRSAHQR